MSYAFVYTSDALKEIEECLSSDRFSTYVHLANGDKQYAINLYLKNMNFSESLFSILHVVEVVLRNKIHNHFKSKEGEFWYQSNNDFLQESEQMALRETLKDCSKRNQLKSGDIIAGLRFGFWTALFGRKYEELWRHELRCIFQTDNRPLMRKQISVMLQDLRKLRNRIAHHECILKMNLLEQYKNSVQLISWLSPVMASWIQENNRFKGLIKE